MAKFFRQFARVYLVLAMIVVAPAQVYAVSVLDFDQTLTKVADSSPHCDMQNHTKNNCCDSDCEASCGTCSACSSSIVTPALLPADLVAFVFTGYEASLSPSLPDSASPQTQFRPPRFFA